MGRKIDLTGQRFGKWTVLGECERGTNNVRYWQCECDCGSVRAVAQSSLKGNKSKSCGCLKSEDLSGMKFHNWTVLHDDVKKDKWGAKLWKCMCRCRKESWVSGSALKTGKSRGCLACMTARNTVYSENIVGKKFGKWVVLKEIVIEGTPRNSRTFWECVCECGTIRNVMGLNLIKNQTTSCGCNRILDLTGKKIGRLRVLHELGTNTYNSVMWKCLCECGNEIIIPSNRLVSGHTSSCGCLFSEYVEQMKGKNHPRYDPNLTDEERMMRNRYEINGNKSKDWVKKVYEVDSFTCQSCGKHSRKLNAHHLNSWNAFPEQRFDTANGITLCPDCHKEFHHFNGYGDNTLEQFRDHIACMVGEEHVLELEESLLSRESEIIGQEQPTHELQTI